MSNKILSDSMGTASIPEWAYWGVSTSRALECFPCASHRMPDEVIKAYAYIKKAAALTNIYIGAVDEFRGRMISTVCDDIIEGKLNGHFPLSIWQSGSGTQTNMNINEVIANVATLLAKKTQTVQVVHPNDHVNASQSTNDTFPTAMHIAILSKYHGMFSSVRLLAKSLSDLGERFKGKMKVGRTHLMDAVPISFSDVFYGYYSQIKDHSEYIERAFDKLRYIPIGGTAVGNGLNAPERFIDGFIEHISMLLKRSFLPADSKTALISSHDPIVVAHSALRCFAATLTKIVSDIIFMISGPSCGLKEINYIGNELGSSIMPGKVNPTQAEMLLMICAKIIGNDTVISHAGMCGAFELNTFKPVMIFSFLESMKLLTEGLESFCSRFLNDLEINEKTEKKNIADNLMMATLFSPIFGYDKVSKVVLHAQKTGMSLLQSGIHMKVWTEEEFYNGVSSSLRKLS